jgi:hypothetical protein
VTVRVAPIVLWIVVLGAGVGIIAFRSHRTSAATSPQSSTATSNDSCRLLRDVKNSRTSGFRVRRALGRNHRLLPDDFVRAKAESANAAKAKAAPAKAPPPSGYLRCSLAMNDELDSSDVIAEPVVTTTLDRPPYLISLRGQPALAELLDVGSRVDVWRGSKPIGLDLPILAIWCGESGIASCSAAVGAPDSVWRQLANSDTSTRRLIVRRLVP